MSKEITKEDKQYMQSLVFWFRRIKLEIISRKKDLAHSTKIVELDKKQLLLAKERFKYALHEYNTWRREKGLRPYKG